MLISPLADRNQKELCSVLSDVLEEQSHRELFALELGSGTGQHVVNFAMAMPFITWQPIRSYIVATKVKSVLQPVHLDVSEPWEKWAGLPHSACDVIVAINLLQYSSFKTVEALRPSQRIRTDPQTKWSLDHTWGRYHGWGEKGGGVGGARKRERGEKEKEREERERGERESGREREREGEREERKREQRKRERGKRKRGKRERGEKERGKRERERNKEDIDTFVLKVFFNIRHLSLSPQPYAINGTITPSCMQDLDQELREMNPEWGLPDIDVLRQLAFGNGMRMEDGEPLYQIKSSFVFQIEMEQYNKCLVFRKL
ncbi:unnamed protein product [Coregonus sp. 'balchen']|nr:unnamed protein product [Coregonus sp. 'balchen']